MILEQKNKELEQFAYVASHDLQEPLRTIASFVDLLQTQYGNQLDEKGSMYIKYVRQSSERMRNLITDLLNYSRIGKKADPLPVDCNELLQAIRVDLTAVITETGAQLNIGKLPVLNAYETELKQLFQNLIVNAIKFRKKEVAPVVTISARDEGYYWRFAVQDNGIGIAEKHKERIFTIFHRLHNQSEYAGTGIGLAICRKIAELHGGVIWVESTPGEGSTFYFTIEKMD